MSKFRIILNLTCFFNDHRRIARIFVKETTHTIQDLQDKIASIFEIENFYLSSQNQFLPASEDIGILDKDEIVWVLRNPHNTNAEQLPVVNSFVATCSKFGKLKPKKRNWESSKQAGRTCENEVIKKAKKSKRTNTTCHEAQEISAIGEESIEKPPKKKTRLLSKSNSPGSKSSEISVDKPKQLNYVTSGSSTSVLDGFSSSASTKSDISYKKYQPPQPITNSYLEKKKLNIIRIDVCRSANSLDTSETNNTNKTSTEDKLNDSIPSGYVKSVVEDLEKKSSPIFTQNNTITGRNEEDIEDYNKEIHYDNPSNETTALKNSMLLSVESFAEKTMDLSNFVNQSVKGLNFTFHDGFNQPDSTHLTIDKTPKIYENNLNDDNIQSPQPEMDSNETEKSAENLITKRKRLRVRRKRSKTAPTEICSENKNESPRSKKIIPFIPIVKPAIHIKFEDFEENKQSKDEGPTVVEVTEEELEENEQSKDKGPTVIEATEEELKEIKQSRDEGPTVVEPAEEEPRAKEPRHKESTEEKQELFTIEIEDSDSLGTTPAELFFPPSMLDSQVLKMINILPREDDLISFQIQTGKKNNATDVSSCIVGRVKEFNKETGKVIFKLKFGLQSCLNSMGVGEEAANYGRNCWQFNWSELLDPRLLYP